MKSDSINVKSDKKRGKTEVNRDFGGRRCPGKWKENLMMTFQQEHKFQGHSQPSHPHN